MEAIQKAIYTQFSNDADLSAAVTDLYFTLAPPDTDRPYITFANISGVEPDTFNENHHDSIYQFTIISEKPSTSEINDIYDKLRSCYDYATLTLTESWNPVVCQYEWEHLTMIERLWHYYIRYRIDTEK